MRANNAGLWKGIRDTINEVSQNTGMMEQTGERGTYILLLALLDLHLRLSRIEESSVQGEEDPYV